MSLSLRTESPETSIILADPEFGGRHCETSALRKALAWEGLGFSEAMLFGLGGGIGFIYWQNNQMARPFIGGRNGKFPDFIERIAAGVGVELKIHRTASSRKAWRTLRQRLAKGTPAIVYGDLFHLPYFHANRHFGGHAFVVYGLDDAAQKAWISDRAIHPRWISFQQLEAARGSEELPFPPKHMMLELQVPAANGQAVVSAEVITDAIRFCVDANLHPPISNFGVPGIGKLGQKLTEWVKNFDSETLLDHLCETFVNLELAGTGGCAFRLMYKDFLEEALGTLNHPAIAKALPLLNQAVMTWKALVEGLLPECCGPLSELRKLLCEKNRLFEEATQLDLVKVDDILEQIRGCRERAMVELSQSRKLFESLPHTVDLLQRTELVFFKTLAEV